MKKFSRFQKSLITKLKNEVDNLTDSNNDLELQYQAALPSVIIEATETKRNLATISSQVQELRSTGDKLQEVLRGKESELQQALADLRKLQDTKEREEYMSTQVSSVIQELQLS